MTSTVVQKLLLVLSICLICLGLGLTISGAFSPAWQVVDIREFRAEHQHGLWWDCIRSERHVVAVGDFYEETPLHCMYKFDSSAQIVIREGIEDPLGEDGAAGEAVHHEFWAWHKAILFFIILSQILALIAIGTGVCTPCFHPTAFAFTISLFFAMLFSVIADGVFFISANRVDNRFVTGMVGTYEQRIGYAFYLHLGGTLAWILAFLFALVTTYKFITSKGTSDNDHRTEYTVLKQNLNENAHLDPLISKTKILNGKNEDYKNGKQPRSILQHSNNTSYNAPTPPPRGYYRETIA